MTSHVVGFYMALGGLFGLAAWMAIWARRQTRARHVAMALFVLALPGIVVAAVETAGFPKPLAWAWELNGIDDLRVLSAKLIQDEAIYLYVDVDAGAPRSYSMSWNNEEASKIQGLMDGAKEQNGQFMMQFEWSWDTNAPQFHPLPQPVIPLPKPEMAPTPRFES